MNQDNIKVSLETKDGRAVRTYVHEGRTYIESHENVEYRIRVKNKTGKRIKACVSVDGISIVTGKAISDKPDETGYVIGPHAEELFKGYRVDENTVAEFKFVKKAVSYATEQGAGQGNGVIAVRAWSEKIDPNKENVDKLAKLIKDYGEKIKSTPVKEYVPYPVWPTPRDYNPWVYPTYPDIWCSTSDGVVGASFNASVDAGGQIKQFACVNNATICGTMKLDASTPTTFTASAQATVNETPLST